MQLIEWNYSWIGEQFYLHFVELPQKKKEKQLKSALKRKIKTHEKQPHPRHPSSHEIKRLGPKILQTTETQNPSTKNYTILITRSTSDPLKASPTTTQLLVLNPAK